MDIPDHPHTHGWFDLPDDAGKDLIAKAIFKIPQLILPGIEFRH